MTAGFPPLTAVEGVGGVAVTATQRAAGQAHEHGRPAGVAGFALQRQEDLGDLQTVQRRLHDFAGRGEGGGVHGAIVEADSRGSGLGRDCLSRSLPE